MYYEINEETARRAKEMSSFYDYEKGSATNEYIRLVDCAKEIADRQKLRVDPMYHESIDGLFESYCKKLAANLNNGYAIECRCPSVMIAGPANFPVRKKEKQNSARDKNMQEYNYIQGFLDKIRSTGMGGISSDDPQAVAKLELKLKALEESQQHMKDINAYYRKHKTLDGCEFLSLEQINEVKSAMASSWRSSPVPFEGYALSNNNANIHRIRERLESLKKSKERAPKDDVEFPGGKVVENTETNRIQIIFDGKPDADIRAILKSNGFRWAPSENAWQRQLTQNGIYAAKRIANELSGLQQ